MLGGYYFLNVSNRPIKKYYNEIIPEQLQNCPKKGIITIYNLLLRNKIVCEVHTIWFFKKITVRREASLGPQILATHFNVCKSLKKQSCNEVLTRYNSL
jgi:hypothetical protein